MEDVKKYSINAGEPANSPESTELPVTNQKPLKSTASVTQHPLTATTNRRRVNTPRAQGKRPLPR